jgi:hypothetical protein
MAHRRATDGGVVAMMVLDVQPASKTADPLGL